MANQELVMETTHGRKGKCKTEFKAVVNKVLVSGLVLATLMTSTVTPALAATGNIKVSVDNASKVVQNYGVSYEDSISDIKLTINAINEMRAKGTVSDAMISKLANQIYALSQSVNYSNDVNMTEVANVLDKAEQAVSGLTNGSKVETAIIVTRTMLGIDNTIKGNSQSAKEEVFAAPMVQSFSDVQQGAWYYDSVMAMTKGGYFAGKGDIVNGVGTFAPNDTMTKAEFLTVVARILYDEDNLKAEEGDAWWSVYYTALVNGGVITTDEFKIEDLSKPMTRQEMSLVAVRALEQRGEILDSVNPNVKNAIPDYDSIGTFYRTNVVKGYQLGLLCGNDDAGTFKPLGSLDRASATMVLYRIVAPSVRIKKDFSTVTSKPSSTVVGQQTIREGEQSKRVPAKEGDIFIKKDGTQIVLKKGPSGVVGEGQGVAPDLGMYGTNGGYVIAGDNWENQLMLGLIDDSLHPYFVNAKGYSLNNNSYRVNATTGEGHWSSDWSIIEESIGYMPDYDGTYNGELSKDAYSFYVWDNDIGMWFANFTK